MDSIRILSFSEFREFGHVLLFRFKFEYSFVILILWYAKSVLYQYSFKMNTVRKYASRSPAPCQNATTKLYFHVKRRTPRSLSVKVSSHLSLPGLLASELFLLFLAGRGSGRTVALLEPRE